MTSENIYLDNLVKRSKYYYGTLGVCTAVGLVITGIGSFLQEYTKLKSAEAITTVGAGLAAGGIIGALYLAFSHMALKSLEDEVNKID